MAHFYMQTESGVEARHFVPVTSRPGELRPTRITDVRKWWKNGHVVVPSVTTILNVLDKAALVSWKVEQHLRQAWLAGPEPFSDFEYEEDYLREIKLRTELELQKAPDAGTDVHKVLEDYFNGVDAPIHMTDICENVMRVIYDKCGLHKYELEKRFTDARGFGGCSDLVIGDWVIDYKTKQTADKFKPGKMVYPDHSRQLAAYREGLGIPSARCANVFICIETGEVDFHEHTEEQLIKGWNVFSHALAIWKLENDYPMMEQAA